MKKPLLSICVPTYHRGKTAYNSIKKILDHDVDYIEVVASDNASPDNTQELLSQIEDSRFKYFRNDTNIGAPNIISSIMRGSGKWCMIISDEDTIYNPDWKALESKLENSDDVGVFRANVYDETGRLYVEGPYEKRLAGSFEAFQFIKGYGQYLSGIVFRREPADEYFKNVNKSTFFYLSYVHMSLAIQFLQDWAIDNLYEISTIMGEDESRVYTDQKTVSPMDGLLSWAPDGRVRQERDAIDVWMGVRTDELTRQRLVLHTGLSVIKNVSNTCPAMFDEKAVGDALLHTPERIALYKNYGYEEWQDLIINSKKEVEEKIFSVINKYDEDLLEKYKKEADALIKERMEMIDNVLKENGR